MQGIGEALIVSVEDMFKIKKMERMLFMLVAH
jgi:hypothetical protein